MGTSKPPLPGEDGAPLDAEMLEALLGEIVNTRMPFGKFGPEAWPPSGRPIDELPLEYLEWFRQRGGFPRGRLGKLMAFVHQVKAVGMDVVFEPGRRARRRE